jgi:hypothetical protein
MGNNSLVALPEELPGNSVVTPMAKKKIAIACQGGGSQTAFTAGVLAAFFGQGLHLEKQIVSLSGTSGGAVCASLAWYGLLKASHGDPTPIHKETGPNRVLTIRPSLGYPVPGHGQSNRPAHL